MNNKKTKYSIGALTILGSIIPTAKALAVCPVCTFAVGAGVGLARWLKIDDTISGIWIGALTLSLTFWTVNWLKKKNWSFKGSFWASFIFYVLLIIIPLYYIGIIGHDLNTLWGIDKIILGSILGALGFLSTHFLYQWMKKRNGDRAYFPFQKVVMPLSLLIILSLIFYFITK